MWPLSKKKKKSKKKKCSTKNRNELPQSTTPTTKETYYATLQQEPTLRKQKPVVKKGHSKSVGHVEDHSHFPLEAFDHLKFKKSKSVTTYGLNADIPEPDDLQKQDKFHRYIHELELQKSISSISSAFDVDIGNDLDEKDDKIMDNNDSMDNIDNNIHSAMWNTDNFNESMWNKACSINSFEDCYCVQRILYIMKYYHASENIPTKYPQSKMKAVLNKLETYDGVMLMNDYIHIKEKHFKQDQYKLIESDDEDNDEDEDEDEDNNNNEEQENVEQKMNTNEYPLIHEYFSKQCFDTIPCETDFCKCIERNFRDRVRCGKDNKYRKDLYRNRDTINEDEEIDDNDDDTLNINIISKQLLDTIHCFIFHPQMRNEDKIEIDNNNKQRIIPSGPDGPLLFRPISVSYYEHSVMDEFTDDEHEQKMNKFNHKYKRSTLMSDALSIRVKQPTLSVIKFTINDVLTPRQSKKLLFKQKTTNLLKVETLQRIMINDDDKLTENVEQKSDIINNQMVKPGISDPTMQQYVDLKQSTETEEKQASDIEDTAKIEEEFSYEFGIKMIYDKDSREGRQNVFNVNKHSSFHDELLNNKIMAISQEQWQNCMKKALIKIKTVRAREIIGRRGKYVGKCMELDHIMAILLYCNYDELQRKFRSTFRRNDQNEIDTEVRARHGNYYFWGKLLHDAVYCFGRDIKTSNICIYHGLQQKLLFSEFEACFYSPLSTTPSLNVASTFQGCNEDGIILKLVKSQDYSAYYLNVSWLSDFCDEEERLFHCSNKGNYLHIFSIIKDTIDYRKYVASLNLLDQIINPDFFISYNTKIKKQHQKRLVRMMKYQLKQTDHHEEEKDKNDDFVDELIQHFCANKISIGISLDSDDLNMFRSKLKRYIVNLTISCNIFHLFPRMQMILIEFIEYNEMQLIKFMDNFIALLSDQNIEENDNDNNNKGGKHLYSVMFTDIFVDSNDQREFHKMMKITWPKLLENKGWIVMTNDKYPGRMELRQNNTRQRDEKRVIN